MARKPPNTYDKQRECLQVMNLTADGQTVMENKYRYNAVDNILGITNAANPTSLTKLSSLAITNLQRKFDKLLFSYLFIRVGNFSKERK